jgi:hypothetical protein
VAARAGAIASPRRRVVHRHGVLYDQEYGWDQSFDALVVQIVADYVKHHHPERESAEFAEPRPHPAR